IQIEKPKSICFVTDDAKMLNNTFKLQRCWQEFDIEIISEHYMHDFAFLASAKRLCIANSTFGWWAAWLSNAERIYYPDIGNENFNNLWVYDEDRYIRINV
ncbi:uncharacterized protein METZ01_LOCUS330850, partial [marine metagenome]